MPLDLGRDRFVTIVNMGFSGTVQQQIEETTRLLKWGELSYPNYSNGPWFYDRGLSSEERILRERVNQDQRRIKSCNVVLESTIILEVCLISNVKTEP